MGIRAQGFLGRVRAQHRTLWSFGSALLASALLLSSADRLLAAAPAADAINHSVPQVAAPAPLQFSAPPADAEFLRTGLFAEPLAPVAITTARDNQDLAQALLAYHAAVEQAGARDAVEPLLEFLASHPDSPWKPALQLNLGIIYRQTGHFSRAMATWQAGWNDSQALSDPHGRAVANAIVARLSQLEAYLGRKELLQPLLASIQGRPVGGTAAQLITDSHTGLFEMQHHPETSFLCGPLALTRILRYGNGKVSPVSLKVLEDAHSTPSGLSLSMVQRISAKAGMNYQMAFRTPGAAVILPSVAHWKVGHYAAVVDKIDGRYSVQDSTFGEDIRVSPATLDEEASGYFLVPKGALPKGWRSVSAAEGSKVWGRGDTGTNHDTGCTGPSCSNDCPPGGGCTSASFEPEVVGLQLHDAPVGYVPPVGPTIKFDLYYSHRDTQQPSTFAYSNFGPKWTFTWLSYVTDSVNSNDSATVYQRGGGNEPYTFSSGSATSSYPGPYSQATLTRTVSGGASTGFTLTNPDGSFQQFSQAVGNQFFMTAFGDPYGNKVTLTYDSQMRIVAITDAVGQVSTLSYGLSGNPLVVTQITDPFGRSASFAYNSSGQLASITDVLGITSSYTYGQGSDPDFVNTLTTPYGATTFSYGDVSTNASLGNTRFLKTVDALNRTSYVEYDQGIDAGDTSGGVMKNSSLIPTGMSTCNEYLYYRNTFVFDANEYAQATQGSGGLNYSLAHVIHWLHTSDVSTASRVKESEKQPLENRIWYNYAGQPSCIQFGVSAGGVVANGASNQPTAIGRVLDSGATQLQTFQYNANGNVTQATDPVGRQITYTYASNGIDRLSVSNTTGGGSQLLESRTYNSQHLPLTITGTNGATVHYQYNAAGQTTRYTDQLGHATALTYDGSGHLKTIQGPINGATYSFAYDNVGRVAAATDPVGSTIHFTYDAADRPRGASYPDGTTSQFTYNLLDLASSTDRMGQTTSYLYDADRELIKSTDPLGHTLQQGYNAAGQLNAIIDANGHTTTVVLDSQSRAVGKQYADGTSQSLIYENSLSLPASITDALSQTTTYTYNTDNTPATVNYSANQPTASVSLSYDPAYQRIVSMTDGIGTTTYTYYPVSSSPTLGANQVQSITGPIAGSGGSDTVTYSYDALNRIIGSNIDGVAQSVGFDALGRITSASNALDSFTYSYADATSRLTGLTSTQGPALAMSYFGPQGNELLQQISASTQSGASLAQFGYTNNADYNTTSFTTSSPTAQTTSYAYDTANRLQSAQIGSGGSPQYVYGYDAASNLTAITANGPQQSYTYTSTNSITTGSYDGNGSLTALGGNSYTWDGANRLVAFSGAAGSSSFTYDGLGRLVRVVDTSNGAVVADHSYFWCGNTRCLAHDNTQGGAVSTQYFSQGALVGGTPYYYVRDKLGSVNQLVTTGGSVVAQYSYDPYGNQTTLSGTVVSDIGYAGYFYHQASGLNFALYRAYDPTHARWLNRDPIAEAGGVNLYAYTYENSVSRIDPSGLAPPSGLFGLSQQQLQYLGQIASNPAAVQYFESTGQNPLMSAADAEFEQKTAEMGQGIAQGYMIAGAAAPLLEAAVGGAMMCEAAVPTYRIIDGVRRAKAAELAGLNLIPAEILGSGGQIIQAPISSLLAPYEAIDTTASDVALTRWLNTLTSTLEGSTPPPILVQPGTVGTPISSVSVLY